MVPLEDMPEELLSSGQVPTDDLPDEIRSVPTEDLPEPAQHASRIATTVARVAPALLGAGIGSVVPVVGTAAGGAIGAGLGEGLAQYLEGEFRPAQIPLSVLLGTIPAARFSGVTSTLGRIGVRTGEGAAMGAGGTAASELIEGRIPGLRDVATGALVGAGLGAGFGGVESRLARSRPGAALKPVPAADLPEPVQLGLEFPQPAKPDLSPNLQIQARIKELEAENARLGAWNKQKPGTQSELFAQPGLEPDPIFKQQLSPPELDERQIRKMNMLLRNSPEQAGAYLENIMRQHQAAVPVRSIEVGAKMLGIPAERGRVAAAFDALTSDPTLPYKPTSIGLFLRKLGQESSKMVEGFGPHGQALVGMVQRAYDGFEAQLARYLDGPQGVTTMASKLKLTPQERTNITDVMEGIAAPLNDRVEAVTNIMKQQRAEIAQRASFLEIRNPETGEIVPWVPRENYMPHFVDFDQVVKDPARLAKVVQEIQLQESVRSGKPISIPEAQNIFNQMRRNSRQEYGHLEVARQFEFSDYERDGIKAWSRYVEGSLKRLSEAEVFQPKGENIKIAINGIGLTAGDDAAFAARRYMAQIMGRDPLDGTRSIDQNAGGLFNFARSMQVGLKLGQAVIANASQSNVTGLVTGYQNLARGFQELRTAHGQEFGRLAGATIEQTMRDLNEALGVGKFGGAVLKLTGFSKVEQFNRMLAANSGKMFARDLAEKLANGATGRAAETYKRHLRKMGIEPMEVISRGFKLTQDEELSAARSVIARTQFKVRPQELPLYWSGPLGKLVTQFSSFGFKAAKAINDEVIREARQGNYAPLARFLLVTPLVGEVFADIQSVAKGGRERPETLMARIAENYASIGALGLFYDAFRSASYGEVGVLRRLAGPTISDASQIVVGTLGGNPKALGKMAAQNVPLIGPALRPTLFPPQERQ